MQSTMRSQSPLCLKIEHRLNLKKFIHMRYDIPSAAAVLKKAVLGR